MEKYKYLIFESENGNKGRFVRECSTEDEAKERCMNMNRANLMMHQNSGFYYEVSEIKER
jgi:hypothetical protein